MAYPFAGLKKQLNKANQYMSEKMTGIEGTKLDDDFQEMERRTDIFIDTVEDLQIKTKEYLQPNPTVRAKMAAVKGISKLSGQAKASTYPQPEGTLGEAMGSYGRKLQQYESASIFSESLIEFGESLKQMADLKYALDDSVKQNFLEPLHQTQSKDLKEVMHHRKKLQGRKLDYDCKKRKGASDDELKLAEEKFAESLQHAQQGMHNLLDGHGAEHISQLAQLCEAMQDYHRNCAEILQGTAKQLKQKALEASAKPRTEFGPKILEGSGLRPSSSNNNLSSNITSSGFTRSSSENNLGRSQGFSSGSSGHSGSYSTSYNNNIYQPPLFNLVSTSPSVSPVEFPSRPRNTSSVFDDPGWGPVMPTPMPRPTLSSTSQAVPSCKALYDFEAENSSELSFKEGDIILLKARVDENWSEGSVNGRTGFFPASYVTIIVPLS